MQCLHPSYPTHTASVKKKTDGGNLTVVLITGRKEFKGKEVGVGGWGGGEGTCVLDAQEG